MNRIVSSLSALILTANCYALSTADRKSPDWDFNNPELGKEWSRLGNTSREDYSLTERGGFLRIKSGGDTLQSSVLSSLVGRPQEHRDFQSSTRFEVSDGATAGMTVYLAASSRYDLCVSDGRIHLRHRVGENSGDKELEAVPTGFIEVKVKGTP